MNTQRQSFLGQGPKMFRPAAVWVVISGVAAWLLPEVFRITSSGTAMAGWMLIVVGAILYGWSGMRMRTAVNEGRLDTGGPFAVVRHPMYTAWILFLFPGIALASGAWMILGSAVIAWLAFRRWGAVEEQDLVVLFGDEYREYQGRVGAVVPFVK